MSNTSIVAAVAGVLIVGGGIWWASNAPADQEPQEAQTELDSESEETATASETTDVAAADGEAQMQEGSIRELMTRGEAVECSFSFAYDGGVSGEGAGYFAGDERMRMETTITQNGSTGEATYVITDNTMYMWGQMQGQQMAMKLPVPESEAQTSSQNQLPVKMDNDVSFRCSPWTVDEEKFAIPQDREFMDMGAMMQGAAY